MNNSINLINRAKFFAIGAHEGVGQKRKYTGFPYWLHCENVADITSNYIDVQDEYYEVAIASAWLHDVLEDTKVTRNMIRHLFGLDVSMTIYHLTDKSKPKDGNREKRKAIDRKHIEKGNRIAHTIKCADLIDNTRSIVAYNKDFAKVYLKEKELLLEVLTKADISIRQKAYELLRKAQEELLQDRLK